MKLLLPLLVLVAFSCNQKLKEARDDSGKIKVLFDTDANNELDDQHALAYLFFNGDTFDVTGVTVNATRGGGDADMQAKEAERIMKLCTVLGKVPLVKGATRSFESIQESVKYDNFDGAAAVNFIILQAKITTTPKLVLLAVGKLTNVALALKKDPTIAEKIRLVWLGSNYPDPGEYNLDNDTASVNYILRTPVEFEMVTVRYGKPTGTGAVQATKADINAKMAGKGPHIDEPITGRHGGSFTNFGDYSVNLFDHIDYHGNPPARALYDMVAVAIVKHPAWGEAKQIPAPILLNNVWVERPGNPRKITVWENFNKDEILKDFYNSMEHYSIFTR